MHWAELIGRVAAERDRAAFRLLFDHFAPRVKGWLLRTGAGNDEAEEIAQETLIAVWRKADRFDPASAGAAAWIFTIARNLRIDAARRSKRSRQIAADAAFDAIEDAADSQEMAIVRENEANRVAAALRQLPAEQSTAIRMSFIEQRPHSEISAALGLPLGTVKSRIRLAMSRLRELLDEPE